MYSGKTIKRLQALRLTGLMEGHEEGSLILGARGDIHPYEVVI
jgi:hypothetical protein